MHRIKSLGIMWAHSHAIKAHGIAKNTGWGFIKLQLTELDIIKINN